MGDFHGTLMRRKIKVGLYLILSSLCCYLSILCFLHTQAVGASSKTYRAIENVRFFSCPLFDLYIHIPFIFGISSFTEVQNGRWHALSQLPYTSLQPDIRWQRVRRQEALQTSYSGYKHRRLISLPFPFNKIFPSPSESSSSPSPSPAPSPFPSVSTSSTTPLPSRSPTTPSIVTPSSSPSAPTSSPSQSSVSSPVSFPLGLPIIPKSSALKPVVVAVIVTAVATSVFLLVAAFFRKKLKQSRKKLKENPYSAPYGDRPLLETSNRSDIWKDSANATVWTNSIEMDDSSVYSIRSHYNNSFSGGESELTAKVNGHREGLLSNAPKQQEMDVLGNSEWMGPSGFRAFSTHVHATKGPSAMLSTQDAVSLHALPRPPAGKAAKPEATAIDLFFGGFGSIPASQEFMLGKGQPLTGHAVSSRQPSTKMMQHVPSVYEEEDLYPYKSNDEETDLYPYKSKDEETDLYPYKSKDEETDLYPCKPLAAPTETYGSNPFLTPERHEGLHSHSSYAAAIFAPEETSLLSARSDRPSDVFNVPQSMPKSNKSAHAASQTTYSFSTQAVQPLPLPPALVSAAIVRAQKKDDVEIALSTPVKSVALALSNQHAETHLTPIPSSRLSYRAMAENGSLGAMNLPFLQATPSVISPDSPAFNGHLAVDMKVGSPSVGNEISGGVLSSPGAAKRPNTSAIASLPPEHFKTTKELPSPPTPPPPKVPGGNTTPFPTHVPPKPPNENTPPQAPPVPPPPLAPKGPPKGPPPPPPKSNATRPPLPPKPQGHSPDEGEEVLKLKPLHWDKVSADPSRSMVWDRLKAGSFHLDENGIATLFGLNTANVKKEVGKSSLATVRKGPIDLKRSQNVAIQLKALNISTKEICEALLEGDGLKPELLEVLVKMSPTLEEQKALMTYSNDSTAELGPAERFLISVLEIPSAFQRIEAMQFKASFKEDMSQISKSLQILETACGQIRDSRLFLKLLEAVLKTGNLMNRGTIRGEAEAFKLDTLLKLVDVKSANGKITLLHFVVEEIAKSEGLRVVRASKEADPTLEVGSEEADVKRKGLEVVVTLFNELESVKRAAAIDADALNQAVSKIVMKLSSIQAKLKTNFWVQASSTKVMSSKDSFHANIELFCSRAADDVARIKQDATRVLDNVKQATAYFHGNQTESQPLRLLVIVSDFLSVLEKVCKDVAKPLKMTIRG